MLNYTTFPLRNLRYHWRSSLPVILGVAVGAAVLAGALLIGDSLRGSLRERALRQLAGFQSAYIGTQFLREEAQPELPDGTPVLPMLILQGSLRVDGPAAAPQLPKVTVYGLTEAGRESLGLPPFSTEFGMVISTRVADGLKASSGSRLLLGVEKMSNLPRSSFLSRRDSEDVTNSRAVTVTGVLPADAAANDFNLNPSPQAAQNVFVRLADLQALIAKPDRVNAMLSSSGDTATLNEKLGSRLTLDDWGLRVTIPTQRSEYLSVESEQLVLNGATVSSIEKAAKNLKHRSEPTMAYLANAITRGSTPLYTKQDIDRNQVIPYSVVAALDPGSPAPLGPFLPPGVPALTDSEILLLDWPDSPFKDLKPGEPITLTYFKPEMEASLDETFATFTLKGLVPLSGPALDPNLTPPFPGITDKLNISEWNSPFEMNRTRLRPNDRNEQFWKKYRTTPKAYITLAKGEALFGSRFGKVTSVRVEPLPGQSLPESQKALSAELLKTLDPATNGIEFLNLRERMLTASKGGTDFGMLFLAFSWLLIFTGLLLVGLLFRLSIDRRAKEVGLLLATGYAPGQVRSLLIREGMLLALVGSVLGVLLAVGYAALMLKVLIRLWPDREVGNYLQLHTEPLTPIIALILTLVISYLTILFSLRGLVRIAPPALLRGETKLTEGLNAPVGKPLVSLSLAGLLLLVGGAALVAGGSARTPDERSMAFFGGGGLLMIAGLLFARVLLKRQPVGASSPSVLALGFRNAGRNPMRSLLTATLIAVAAFLVISVESFRRSPDQEFLNKSGGSGGFPLLAEADVPLFNPFDREAGLYDLELNLQKLYQDGGANAEDRAEAAVASLKPMQVFAFQVQGGDDASCLNLYQATKPRVLGVPKGLIERGGFRFTQTLAQSPEEQANPWLLLNRAVAPGEPIPIIAEQNSVMFMLKTTLGGVIEIPDENGTPTKVQIVAMIQDSVFQSELLIGEQPFKRLYPKQEGYRFFMIDPQTADADQVKTLLQQGFRNHGLIVTRSADKVAQYQAVVGAYLTTFQLLGGFALLLAILGLGVIILRGVWERTSELALLRAVGYRPRDLQLLVLAETLLVLAIGLGVGIGAALLSVLPNFALGGTLPWPQLLVLINAIVLVAVLVTFVATVNVARVPIIAGLRRE